MKTTLSVLPTISFSRVFLQFPTQRLFSLLHTNLRRKAKPRLSLRILCFWLVFILSQGFIHSSLVAQSLEDNTNPVILRGLQFKSTQFNLPEPEVSTLNYQATLFKLKDSRLPIVQLSLHFPNGLEQEQIHQAGTLHATLQLLKKGGTQKLPGAKFSIALNRLGAKLNVNQKKSSWSVQLKVLRPNFDRAFALLRQLLLRPALPANELENIKNALIVNILSRNEKPENLANESLKELLHPGHRIGHRLQKTDVTRLQLSNVRHEILRRIHPDHMYITAVGDIKGLALGKKYLKPLLQDLKQKAKGKALAPTILDVRTLKQRNHSYRGKILLITKPVAQVAIRIGAYLPAHRHPDFYALQVANHILGGGSFTSRLLKKIRVEQGLAYYAYSYNSFFAQYGIFKLGSGTRVNKASQALELILEEIDSMKEKKKVKEAEINLAKESILNGLVFQFDTAQKIVNTKVRFRLHKMPKHYLRKLPQRIRNLSQQSLGKVMPYWQTENLYIVVVGPKSLQEELQKIRPVILKTPDEILFK